MEVKDSIAMYDLAVIGGGPAGCAASIMAARGGRRVLLLEQGHFPRHKVCGEFVSGEATTLLEKLLTPRNRPLAQHAPRISQARIYAGNAEISAEIDPPALSISRFELDLALWQSAVQSGADGRENCAVRAIEVENRASRSEPVTGFRLLTSGQSFKARALINASGRWSFLTGPATRARAGNERWIGLKGHFLEPSGSASVDLYFFRGGYCGVQPVGSFGERGSGLVVNVCAMVKPEVARDLREVLRCHPRLATRSQNWQAAIEPVSTAPLVFHQPEPVRGNLLQVGDAATFIDPFVGDGISLALRSGSLAAEALASFFAGQSSLDEAADNYSSVYHSRLSPIFRVSSRMRRMLNWPDLLREPALFVLAATPGITRCLMKMTR